MKQGIVLFITIVLVSYLPGLHGVGLGASSVDEVYRVLDERGISFDRDAVGRSAVEALLKTIDPRARIIETVGEKGTKVEVGAISRAEEWPRGICYLKLTGMRVGSSGKVLDQLDKWHDAEKTGLILDIRGAGGEDLDMVDRIAGLLLDKGDVLYKIRDSAGDIVETRETGDDGKKKFSVPWIVLVDEKTRDESELLAAVLKGRSGVLLVGTRTRGDAGIRELIPLSDIESVYIATRWIVMPDGSEYNSVGVSPDVGVTGKEKAGANLSVKDGADRPLSEEMKKKKELLNKVSADAALGKATDILLGLRALGMGQDDGS